MTGLTFGQVVGAIPISDDARAAAHEVGIPWWDDLGMYRPAAWWALKALPVFPLRPVAWGGDNAGKTPLHAGPADDPSRRLTTLEDVWAEWGKEPWANIGVTTRANGLLVLDIDPRDGGSHSMLTLADEIGIDLSDVPRQTSPRGDGGCHLFWRLPTGCPTIKAGQILDGIDVPWQVPVAPSLRHVEVGRTARGEPIMEYKPYLWTAGHPSLLPEAPAELIAAMAELGRIKGVRPSRRPVSGKLVSAVTTDANELLETGIPHGRQNTTIQSLATSMARRGVRIEDAVDCIARILAKSPQDNRAPWTMADLVGTPTQPGIVVRAYQFIEQDKQRETVELGHMHQFAAALRASL